MDSDNIPAIQREVYNILQKKFKHVSGLEFKYYVCGAYAKLKDVQSKMSEQFEDIVDIESTQSVVIRSSPKEIVPNYVLYNVRSGLIPEANKHKAKYLHRSISHDHLASDEWLGDVSTLDRRVLATEIPADFKAKKLKTSEDASYVARLLKDRKNCWKQFSIVD